MSADDSFPIFTLLWISEIFFCFNVFESKSYIAFSSDLVKITIQPDCSKSSCNFKVIFKLICASVIPLLLSAPSSDGCFLLHFNT